MKRLVALDLDGTLTQHRTPLEAGNRLALDALARRYALVFVGAGACARIYGQTGGYPADIIGNYGMQCARCDGGALEYAWSDEAPCADRASVLEKARLLRQRFGATAYEGESVEFHPSGMLTFPLLGTAARIEDKLAYDPDQAKRKAMYPRVRAAFADYTVFIGGSSSFDILPKPYDKLYALDRYAAMRGYARDEIVFMGDGYNSGGNDEQVYLSDVDFIKVDDYRKFAQYAEVLL